MAQMQWDESLSVGVELIDDQHKTWLQRYNDLVSAVESRQGPREIARTLGFLVDYTELHFATEQKHMTDTGYPGLEDHKTEHEGLTEALGNLVDDFQEEGATHILADFLHTFLGNWLIEHIRQVDALFGAYLKENQIEIPREPDNQP